MEIPLQYKNEMSPVYVILYTQKQTEGNAKPLMPLLYFGSDMYSLTEQHFLKGS
jgi:hypothetical protein